MINHLYNPAEVSEKLICVMKQFFTPKTLVLCDTRLLIKREVLPYIPHVGYYDQRILPLLSNTHIVVSDGVHPDILRYFHTLGFCKGLQVHAVPNDPSRTLTENILKNPEYIEKLRACQLSDLFALTVDEDVEMLAKTIGTKTLVSASVMKQANDKLALKKFLFSAGLPTVEGVSTADPKIIREYFAREEHCFFKSPHGVSGYGFWSNKNNTLEEILSEYHEEELIIERVIEKIGSPSIQFCISGTGAEDMCIFGFTDQILEGGQYYTGNASPSVFLTSHAHLTDEILHMSEAIIEYIQSIGYIGFGGIDFMIGTDGDVYATEVNARLTGATYPTITSMLLSGRFDMPWEYKTEEGLTDTTGVFLKKSMKPGDTSGLFPLCIAPLDQYGIVQALSLKDTVK